MTKTISMLLPTRGRPDWVLRLFDSIQTHTTRLDLVEVVLCMDDDDISSHHLDSQAFQVKRIIGPRNTMGHYNSACLSEATGDIMVLSNDDMVIRTPGWDDRLRAVDNQYPDGIYMAYPNDLFKGAKLCTFPILPRRTCDLLVDPFPRIYKGAFIDYQLLDIFKRLQHQGHQRLHYIEDVVFEHLHFRTGKSTNDATYANRQRFGDDAAFFGMVHYRKTSANYLVASIEKRSNVPAPSAPAISDITTSIGVYSVLQLIIRRIITDHGLPYSWRGFLAYWFFGRTLVAQTYLMKFLR
jgi:hypothetical protein